MSFCPFLPIWKWFYVKLSVIAIPGKFKLKTKTMVISRKNNFAAPKFINQVGSKELNVKRIFYEQLCIVLQCVSKHKYATLTLTE